MKIIIEEGDAGGLAPGVYDVAEENGFVDTFVRRGNAINMLKLNVNVNMDQKPKPVPPGGRYSFEFKRFERIDPDDIVFEATMHDRIDPSKSYYQRAVVNNGLLIAPSMEKAHLRADEILKDIVRNLTHSVVKHVVDDLMRSFTNHVKPTEPPPVATCAKTFADCAKHGNTLQYCGYVNVNTGRHVPCPHTFGSPACTGSKYLAPPAKPAPLNDKGMVDYDMPGTKKPIGFDSHGVPFYESDLTIGPGAGADVESDGGFIGNVVFPKMSKPKDCDVCYGTGRFKGFGGPCSEGCPTKEGS